MAGVWGDGAGEQAGVACTTWALHLACMARVRSNMHRGQAFAKYEFANATSATYGFFLYDLCDVYLELLKPRFYGEAADDATVADRSRRRPAAFARACARARAPGSCTRRTQAMRCACACSVRQSTMGAFRVGIRVRISCGQFALRCYDTLLKSVWRLFSDLSSTFSDLGSQMHGMRLRVYPGHRGVFEGSALTTSSTSALTGPCASCTRCCPSSPRSPEHARFLGASAGLRTSGGSGLDYASN